MPLWLSIDIAICIQELSVLPLFKIKYPEINSENSWNFTKFPEILQKVPVFYISCIKIWCYVSMTEPEGKGMLCKPYPPKHASHRLFHGIPCNGYSIQISYKNSWHFSILEIILENPLNSWKLLTFGRSGNAENYTL